ncbi:MAG: 2-amino-4-hydroxy-6-hydroxymethyldihydropteridine diphosphokinase [Armatimonadota bacterium]|nr:2-amino-4-hydroxy-6-hydroxymethyldihydropteridine diphosphokinase [Armatimonadota bacterium]
MARVFIGIGSNIDPDRNIRAALRLLSHVTRVTAISTFYVTDPEGRPEQPRYYNGVAEIETDLPPAQLKHDALRHIESELGRNRSDDKHAPRTIDLDILIYDDLIISSDDLVIPDPEIANRPYLAIPLAELIPEFTPPGTNQRLAESAAEFTFGDMEPLSEYTKLLREDLRQRS